MSFDLSRFLVKPQDPSQMSQERALPNNLPIQQETSEISQQQPQEYEPFQNESSGSIEEPFDLSKFQVQEEHPAASAARQVGQNSLRFMENAFGIPGSLNNLIWSGIEKGSELIYGEEIPTVKEFGKKFREASTTPESLRETGKKAFGETFEPKNKGEEFRGNIAGTMGSFFAPGVGGITSPGLALGIATAGESAKEGSKLLTNSETKQEITKLGSMFLFDLLGRKINGDTARRFVDTLYDAERALVPQGTRTVATTLQTEINELLGDLNRTNVTSPSSNLVRHTAEELLQDIVNGEADVNALLTAKRRINELRGPSIKRGRRAEEGTMDRLANAVEDSLENYGANINAAPEFYATHRAANDAHATLQRSKAVSSYVGNHLPKTIAHVTAGLFGQTIAGHAASIPVTLATAGTLAATVRGGELLYRVLADPNLRGYYTRVLQHAAARESGEMVKQMEKLDKALKKDKKIQKEFPDMDFTS